MVVRHVLACISVAKKLDFYRGQNCFHKLERSIYIDTAAFPILCSLGDRSSLQLLMEISFVTVTVT